MASSMLVRPAESFTALLPRSMLSISDESPFRARPTVDPTVKPSSLPTRLSCSSQRHTLPSLPGLEASCSSQPTWRHRCSPRTSSTGCQTILSAPNESRRGGRIWAVSPASTSTLTVEEAEAEEQEAVDRGVEYGHAPLGQLGPRCPLEEGDFAGPPGISWSRQAQAHHVDGTLGRAAEEACLPASAVFATWMEAQFTRSAALQSSVPPPRQKQESQLGDDYYVNVGYAIRTLREELPTLFYEKLTFDIYRSDITFRDPLNSFSGMDNYRLLFWALRFHGRIFFRALWVDVVRVWQPSDKVIMVRWSVRGLPRVPWEAQGHFDGTSEYKLDKDGKIYEHKVDNIVMNNLMQPQRGALTVMDLVRLAGARTTPTPTYFQRGLLQVLQLGLSVQSYLTTFTWVRFYWALMGTLTLTESLALGGC
eukprot:TRINITY_DN6377_c0_g1_i1.p1 TRINITY_DN6377_c0_g1~~TRINITY_DN6377_c0_g1_i1.p1  ORF type:complete len:422 (-),score=54.21 TRINITY_DN6377_c0_g1_i1:2438-3703(-)